MKKIFVLLIGLFLLVSLTSCDDTISYEGGVTLSIPKEIKEILVYEGALPTFKFEYDGNVNVADFSTSTRLSKSSSKCKKKKPSLLSF